MSLLVVGRAGKCNVRKFGGHLTEIEPAERTAPTSPAQAARMPHASNGYEKQRAMSGNYMREAWC